MSSELAIQALTFSPSAFFDIVGIYDQNFNQVFKRARPLKVEITPELKPMEHPLENGAQFGDHVVYNPIEAELSVLIRTTTDYEDTYATITQYFNNATKVNIKTKAGIYSNMIIVSYPHREDSEFYDSLVMVIKLKQVLVVNSDSTIAPRNPNKKPTVDKGIVESNPATPSQQDRASASYRLFYGTQ